MAATKFTFNIKEFEEGMKELMEYSRRDVAVVLAEQVKGFSRLVIDLTPPARGGTRGQAAKQLGNKTIDGDVRSLFMPVHPNNADIKLPEMESVLNARRVKGRVASSPVDRRKAARGDITLLVKKKQAKVGFLAGAWITATRKLGQIAAPAWVKRHSGKAKGSTKFRIELNKAIADITNAVPYASNVDGFERRVQAALNIQGRKMKRRAEHFMTQRAKKAGFEAS